MESNTNKSSRSLKVYDNILVDDVDGTRTKAKIIDIGTETAKIAWTSNSRKDADRRRGKTAEIEWSSLTNSWIYVSGIYNPDTDDWDEIMAFGVELDR